MYHFDHPFSVENETGGWTSSALVDKFVDYADFLFDTYGEQVRLSKARLQNISCVFISSSSKTVTSTLFHSQIHCR